ncbi:hypothetical protein HYPSUDRAFT_46207 [Hypholoma sublateritium FD-334 SS-4]|uniref:DUF1857-domain-containing protein n=1 Tax=Hypholoma sublateritium (strain FD-334 SS-4) TaxID=945553 RepID=A0A0D2PB89_HYPSF|nr:hypothetical protein HYPSUDRAFT_46207 [Hypholoma sublateritium FD-334 SS-4]
MSKLSFASSRLVNPPGIEPVITEAQLWAGLQRKVRFPTEFVPAITSCEVISDTGTKVRPSFPSRTTHTLTTHRGQVVRSVSILGGAAAREEVELHEYTIAYFDMPETGNRITNLVSYDEEDRLLLTFSFAGGIPGYDTAASGAARPSAKELNTRIGPAVEHTIQTIRKMLVDGKLA